MSDRTPWYGLRRWRKRSREQLRAHPLCAVCLQHGSVVGATVADHVVPHKGDEQQFWFGELQSLCKFHHDSAKQQEEKMGYRSDIGADGWPMDPRHPVNGHRLT